MDITLSPFAPENLASRGGFGSPVPREPAHLDTKAESGLSSAAASIYLFITAILHLVSPVFIVSRNCVPMVAFAAASPPAQGQ